MGGKSSKSRKMDPCVSQKINYNMCVSRKPLYNRIFRSLQATVKNLQNEYNSKQNRKKNI